MEAKEKIIISVQVLINAPVEKVWKYWSLPNHITKWNNASPDWHTPRAENDLRTGGSFTYRMEAKDGNIGFDFFGTYEKVIPNQQINYVLGDGRRVEITFIPLEQTTAIVELFEAEEINTTELQRNGWQAILNNFKSYIET